MTNLKTLRAECLSQQLKIFNAWSNQSSMSAKLHKNKHMIRKMIHINPRGKVFNRLIKLEG